MSRAAAKPPVTSWSYSRYTDYRLCPARFRFKHILKIEEQKGPALVHGQEVHDDLELFVLKPKFKLPAEIVRSMGHAMVVELKEMKKRGAVPEQPVALDKDWKIIKWDDWDRAWLRVVVDLQCRLDKSTIKLVDYKTGKVNEVAHAEQLELYALYGLVAFPGADVIASAWYVDHGYAGPPQMYTKADLARLKRKWSKAVEPMFRDRQFKAKPGSQCKWCPFSGRKGGPCDEG